MNRPIGLIAGQGLLPIVTAKGIRAAGHKVVCVGFRNQYDEALPGLCDAFAQASVAQPGKWIRLLRSWGASEAVMVGRVKKARAYDGLLGYLKQLPDWRAVRIWYRTMRRDKRSDKLLAAVADELAGQGITLIDTTRYIPECLATAGVMGKVQPGEAVMADIAAALPIVRQMGHWDIGQSIAIKDRDVIAVEAVEGTDAMIARAGELCKGGGWVLVKVAKPGQDMRFDVPTVGLRTIEGLKAAGAKCLAVEAGKVILLEKAELMAAADKARIAVIGVEVEDCQSRKA